MTSPHDDELTSSFEVDINFRQDSVRSLDEVTDLLSRARVESEALSRSSSDVVEHLREAAQAEPIHLMGQDQGGPAFSEGTFSDGRIPTLEGSSSEDRSPTNRLPGPGDEGKTPSRGSSDPSTDRIGPVDSSPQEKEVSDRLAELDKRDPERIENLKAARGLGPDSERSENLFTEGIQGFSGLAQSILSETRPGATFSTSAARAAEGLGALGGNSGLAGLLGGRSLGALGIAGGALTAGVAANAAVQAGGQQIQQYRNMGSVTGDGATEGLGYEVAIRAMAMNPFLTNDQSRQIIMSALSEGYTGQEFETVTDFMAENMKSMNMDVAQSTQILRQNVEEGGQSIQQLNLDLAALKSSTEGGVMSLQERTQLYQQTSGSLIDMGIGGDQASAMALRSLELFEDDRTLSGAFTNILANPSDALVLQSARSAGHSVRNAYQAKQVMGESGDLDSAIYDQLRSFAVRIEQRNNDDLTKRQMFNQRLQSLGINMPPGESNALYEELIAEGSENRYQEATERFESEQFGVQEDDTNVVAQRANEFGGVVGVMGQAVGDTLGMLNFGFFNENEDFASNFSEAYSSTGQAFQSLANTSAKGGTDGQIAALDALNEEFGANNIQIVDEEGNRFSQQGGISREGMEKITSGEYKVRINGRDPVDIKDARQLAGEGAFDDTDQKRLGNTKVDLEISSTPELERLLRFNTRSANQQQADAGYGTAAHNNPPPGDR